jgi:hypothetical protein
MSPAPHSTWTTTSSGSSWPACTNPTPPACSPHPPRPASTPPHYTPRPAAIGQRLTDLSTAFAEGAITLAQLRTGTDTLRTRLTDIDNTLTAAARVNPLIGLAGQPSIAEIWYGTTPERCDGLDIGRRRAVLATLLTVTVLPTSRGRRPDGSYFDPTGIHIEWKTH